MEGCSFQWLGSFWSQHCNLEQLSFLQCLNILLNIHPPFLLLWKRIISHLSLYFSTIRKVKLFQHCLYILRSCFWSFLFLLFLCEFYFSEEGCLRLYRQNIPLIPPMSVIVSDLPQVHCLVYSRMRFVCFITGAHWLLIVTRGSANKPGYFFFFFILYLGVLSLHQLLLFIVPQWVTLHFAPLKFIFPQDHPVLSVSCSILFQFCVITMCWTLMYY